MTRPFPRPTKFAHVVFATRRYEAMLRWYTIVFGARVQFQDAATTFLTFDDEAEEFVRKIRAGVPHAEFVALPPGPVAPPRSSRTDPPIRPAT